MLYTTPWLHKAIDLDWRFFLETPFQSRSKRSRVNALLKTKIDLRFRFRIQDIVGFVLCEVFAEMLTDIGRTRMALHREVASTKCVEKVKPDGQLLTKSI